MSRSRVGTHHWISLVSSSVVFHLAESIWQNLSSENWGGNWKITMMSSLLLFNRIARVAHPTEQGRLSRLLISLGQINLPRPYSSLLSITFPTNLLFNTYQLQMKFSSSIIKLLSWSWTTDNNNSNIKKTPVLQVAKEIMGNNNDNKDVPAAEEVPTFQLDELDKDVVETAALLHLYGTSPYVEFQQHGRYLGAYDLSLVPLDQHGHYGYDNYNQHRPKGCRIQPSQSANARWKTHYGQDTERSNGNRLSFAPVNTVGGYSSDKSEQEENSRVYRDMKKHVPQARYELWQEAQQQFISVGAQTPHERVLDLVQLIQEYGYQQVAKWIANNQWFQSDKAYLQKAKLYIQIDAMHQDLEKLVKFIQAKKGNDKQVAHWFMVNKKNTYMFELAMCHLHHGGIQRNADDEICTLNTREQIAKRRFVYRKVKDVCMEDAAPIVVEEEQPTTTRDIEAIETVSTVDNNNKMASDATITCKAAVVPTCTAVVPYVQKWHVKHFKISMHGQQPLVLEMRMMNGVLLGVVPNDILAALMEDGGDIVKELIRQHKTPRLEAGIASDEMDYEFVTGQVVAEEPLVEVEKQQRVDAEEPLVNNRVDEEDNVDTAQSTLRRSKRRMAAIASQRIAEQIKTKPRRVAVQQPRNIKCRRAAATKKKSTKPKVKGKKKKTTTTHPVTDTQQQTTVQTTTTLSGRQVRKPDRYIPV
ncbi:unknown protein [Seminavis robusta]|uniref:Uncharacterized protein n=1 Tax=Seminavis robusta TaxID=568900 RepID=A0A9N8EAR7_9STRA|nr:unknown protein [Seminavis robusta]|eukprot:Sro736_g195021.1  (699) ;mRNA; f:34438-36534